MKINKITFEDGTEVEFKELPLESFVKATDKNSGYSEYRFRKQRADWENQNIIDNLVMDVEEYAKDTYDLVDEGDIDEKEISDFSDRELLNEAKLRGVYRMQNANIINEDFIERIIELSRRGDDHQIDLTLESLEKMYRIK